MKPSFLLAVAILTGCASLDQSACSNAYETGFRDAIFGLQRQDDLYAPACSRQGARIDVARYAEGWQEGKYEFDRRKLQGGVD